MFQSSCSGKPYFFRPACGRSLDSREENRFGSPESWCRMSQNPMQQNGPDKRRQAVAVPAAAATLELSSLPFLPPVGVPNMGILIQLRGVALAANLRRPLDFIIILSPSVLPTPQPGNTRSSRENLHGARTWPAASTWLSGRRVPARAAGRFSGPLSELFAEARGAPG